jgi:hypothetical protein
MAGLHFVTQASFLLMSCNPDHEFLSPRDRLLYLISEKCQVISDKWQVHLKTDKFVTCQKKSVLLVYQHLVTLLQKVIKLFSLITFFWQVTNLSVF